MNGRQSRIHFKLKAVVTSGSRGWSKKQAKYCARIILSFLLIQCQDSSVS